MAEPIFKQQTLNESNDEITIDLAEMNSLASFQEELLRNPKHLEEKNRGEIGKMTLVIAALLVLVLPMLGGLVAAFGSSAQAQAYTTSVVTLLDAVTRVATVVVWPVMAYYFLQIKGKK